MFEKYDLNQTYLLACSGGPDSMALLDMLHKANFKLIVVHVNYKTRQESDYEEVLVKEYCLKNNIQFFVSIFNQTYKGKSFEDVARKFRYHFFASVYFTNNCAGLFVAHHKDDLLETYLLKKQRNVVNESYLLQETNYIENMVVYRPLILDYYKNDLERYCKENNVPYSIDFTNYLDIHPRNVIRKKIVQMDKNALFKQALDDENELINTRKEVQEFIRYYPLFQVNMLQDKSDTWLMIFLYENLKDKCKDKVNKALLLKLKDFLVSKKANLEYKISNDLYLVKKYQEITFEKRILEEINYHYQLIQDEKFQTPYFKVVDSGLKMEGIYLEKNDYPIIIRNYKSTDKIKLKEGYKKVNRLFIDKKVPTNTRKIIPIIENSKGEIVFVYKLYRKYGLKDVKNNFYLKINLEK